MKVQIVKPFSDKYAAREGKPKLVEITEKDKFVEYPDERAQELIKSGHAVEFKEKKAKEKPKEEAK